MIPPSAFVAVAALALAAAPAGDPPAGRRPARTAAMELTSPAFKPGGFIPKRHSCQGADVSPALAWAQVPPGTKSFALIMDDLDAPAGIWVHWVLYDLPGGLTGLAEGLSKQAGLPDGSKQGRSWGVADFERVGYSGPCPPPGRAHRYYFKLYALDGLLGLPAQATKAQVRKAMRGRVLGQAELLGLYRR